MMTVTVEKVVAVLFGGGKTDLDDGIVKFRGIEIARVESGKVLSIACPNACHNSKSDLAVEFFSKFKVVSPTAPCTQCGGTGWLDSASDEVERVLLLALSVGCFRGVWFVGDDPGVIFENFSSYMERRGK